MLAKDKDKINALSLTVVIPVLIRWKHVYFRHLFWFSLLRIGHILIAHSLFHSIKKKWMSTFLIEFYFFLGTMNFCGEILDCRAYKCSYDTKAIVC